MFGEYLMYGESSGKIDSKGRFNLPKFTCSEANDVIIGVVPNNMNIINFYNSGYFESIYKDESIPEDVRKQLFSFSKFIVKPDKQHRILIPENFKDILKGPYVITRGNGKYVSCFSDSKFFDDYINRSPIKALIY